MYDHHVLMLLGFRESAPFKSETWTLWMSAWWEAIFFFWTGKWKSCGQKVSYKSLIIFTEKEG